jgi:phosphatidylinositol alpha-1,6-mannosyltransferase
MKHLLVTNDFPPKVGGIQSYLWELWRRLPASDVAVLTTPYRGAREWDASQPFRVVRTREPVLLPIPSLARRIDALADETRAQLVLLDPALPLALLGPHLRHRYGLVLHGAEVTVPGRLPLSHGLLRHVLRGADLVVSAGGYALAEATRAAGRALPAVDIPPGVDTDRFRPLNDAERKDARQKFGLPVDGDLVIGVSRLVPRKGFDTLLRAAPRLRGRHPDLTIAIGGSGRDRRRLELLATRAGSRVELLGRVSDEDLPLLYGTADVFAMACRNRWFGLEQEGFGIVFLEAAAAGVAQLAGTSGGSEEAVVDGGTGFVVREPNDPDAVARALDALLSDPERRRQMGRQARARAVEAFSYDVLARRLAIAIDGAGDRA